MILHSYHETIMAYTIMIARDLFLFQNLDTSVSHPDNIET